MMAMTLWTLGTVTGAFLGIGATTPAPAERPPFPTEFGVNIHFTQPAPGEMDLLKKMGCQVVRMDFAWSTIETEKGKYNFRAYDGLVAELERAKIRPYFILDYGNAYYQKGGLTDPLAQDAFARFAGEAVKHFRGKGIIWEIWNEPNILPFWTPKPDVQAYIQLAKKTVRQIRKSDPSAWVVGPATSGFDWEFLEAVFASGLLEDFDAVSVHPYRPGSPESVWEDYAKLDSMMEFFGRRRPILSGEWGYSTFRRGVSEKRQASYLMRMWALNAAAKVPISIFYDWRDDGPSDDENEHRFGVIRQNSEPKPSFSAAQRWLEMMGKWRVARRLEDDKGRVTLLLESKTSDALSTLSWDPNSDELPVLKDQSGTADIRKKFANYLSNGDVRVSNQAAAIAGLKAFAGDYAPRVQASYGPVPLSLWKKGTPAWTILNRSSLDVNLVQKDGTRVAIPKQSMEIAGGEAPPQLEVPGSNLRIDFGSAGAWATVYPERRPWNVVPYVENAPRAAQSLEFQKGSDFEWEMVWSYTFGQGWQYAGIDPADLNIPERAKAALIWVRTDGSGNYLRSRFMDSTRRVFQVNLGTLGEPGAVPRWLPILIPLDGKEVAASWGGNESNLGPRGPLKWAHMLLIDSLNRQVPRSGTVKIGSISYLF